MAQTLFIESVMTKGRVSSAIYIGNLADLSGAGGTETVSEEAELLLKRPFNPTTLPAMAIRALLPGPAGTREGFRIGSRQAPVTPLDWQGRFTARLTCYGAGGGGPFTQNALLQVLRLGNGEIYIPTDHATGAILYPQEPQDRGPAARALFQVELLKQRPRVGTLVEEVVDGPGVSSGFTHGTRIATPMGEVPVENLRAGDLVDTIDHGPRALAWVGRHDLAPGDLRDTPQLRPILIAAGALGRDMPARDLLVSPQLRLRIRSKIARNLFDSLQVLVLAKQLCQIEGIDIRKPPLPVSYFHLMFDQHELITANGAVVESFYPGKRALRVIGPAMQRELLALCPHLRGDDAGFAPARPMLSGHQSRKLVVRHLDKQRPLIS